ncbi:MAG: hypothetical protein K8U03_08575 [Planctomycetia bacterium]|nr:hypothetical protein [Planctomycetia bacterium]
MSGDPEAVGAGERASRRMCVLLMFSRTSKCRAASTGASAHLRLQGMSIRQSIEKVARCAVAVIESCNKDEAMYHAELGQFTTRDPLPQEGEPDVLYDNNWFGRWLDMMKNLYGYVGSNPVSYVDPSGLVTLNADPIAGAPWIEIRGTIDGKRGKVARSHSHPQFKVSYEVVPCECPAGTYRLLFTLDFRFKILINVREDLEEQGWTIAGLYGHELKHNVSLLQQIDAIKEILLISERAYNCLEGKSKADVEKEGRIFKTKAERLYEAAADQEKRHFQNPRRPSSLPSNPLSPVNGEMYPEKDLIEKMPKLPIGRLDYDF